MQFNFQIIHLCQDEKFMNSAIQQFEDAFPGLNVFYVSSASIKDEFKHIKNYDFIYKIHQDEFYKIVDGFPFNGVVILHSLIPPFYDFILSLPNKIPVICFWFGFEIYNDTDYFNNNILLDEITQTRFPQKNAPKRTLREFIRPIYRFIKPDLPYLRRERKRMVIKRINYFGCPFIEEYHSICKLLNLKRPIFKFCYYPLENILDINIPISFQKKNIIIGNSGFLSLNHLDVFSKINNFDLDGFDVIVPLNYGDSNYIKELIDEGEKCFGENFKPLTDFLSLDDYNKILKSVSIAILNNRRQQAFGNTIALLWFGAKVFLSIYNPIYIFLKRIGVKIYSYEDDLNSISVISGLSQEEIEDNRNRLFEQMNKTSLNDQLKIQIKSLIK